MDTLTITVTPAERDDLALALRCWAQDLEEPTMSRKLNHTRRQMRQRITLLADRLDMAEWPAIAAAMPR